MTLEELIETYPEAETYFKNMPEELKTRYTIRKFPPGTIIHQKDYPLDYFGIVCSGNHRVINEFENGNDLMPTKAKYSRYKKQASGKFVIKNAQPNKCWRLWSGAVINVHGEVLPCCFDKASEYSFGNMSKNSFYSCWHSKKASDFREKIHQNRKLFEICRNCTSK